MYHHEKQEGGANLLHIYASLLWEHLHDIHVHCTCTCHICWSHHCHHVDRICNVPRYTIPIWNHISITCSVHHVHVHVALFLLISQLQRRRKNMLIILVTTSSLCNSHYFVLYESYTKYQLILNSYSVAFSLLYILNLLINSCKE